MAQAVQSGIVDLTGEDDDDNSIVRAQAACEKAFAAASRLTNHFESLKTSKSVPYKNSSEHVDLGDKSSLAAIASKSLVPPRLETFSNPTRFDTNGLKNDEKKKAIPRQDFSVPSPGIPFPQSALGRVASRPAKSPSTLERAEGKKRQPGETTSANPLTDTSTIRTPRSAAVSAKQNIAEACNELEEWVNKDPNLIPQQAGVSTPRKPGRPKKDTDEWSPGSDTKNNVEERKNLARIITNSPTPSAGKHGALKANEGNSLFPIKDTCTSLDTKKRKYSGSSQPRDSPVKLARWNEEPSTHRDPISLNIVDPASEKHVHNGTGKNSPAGCFPKCVYPALKAAKAQWKQSLTADELTGIGNSVSLLLESQGGNSMLRGRMTDRTDYQRHCGARS